LACAVDGGFVRFAAIVEYVAQPPTLRCSGDEDRTTQPRRRQAFARAITATTDVVVELSDLAWSDASLMLDFLMLSRRLRAEGRTLVLRDAQPQILALLELVGIDRLPGVRVEPSAPAPVAALA
jgi:anti-anti-sigma regulatory factor